MFFGVSYDQEVICLWDDLRSVLSLPAILLLSLVNKDNYF